MSYYILANQLDGALLQVSVEPLVAETGQILKHRDGDIPDLTKYEWHGGSLAFIQKDTSRILTRLKFMRLLSGSELMAIYTAAKSSVQLEVWLDKFKLAEEISLDDIEIVEGLQVLEQIGILAPGRASEILA